MPMKFTKITRLIHQRGLLLVLLILLTIMKGYGATASIDDSWTQATPMPTPRADFRAATVDGMIYVIGGTVGEGTALSIIEVYDPAMDFWTTKTPMPTARGYYGMGEIGGKIYIFGWKPKQREVTWFRRLLYLGQKAQKALL